MVKGPWRTHFPFANLNLVLMRNWRFRLLFLKMNVPASHRINTAASFKSTATDNTFLLKIKLALKKKITVMASVNTNQFFFTLEAGKWGFSHLRTWSICVYHPICPYVWQEEITTHAKHIWEYERGKIKREKLNQQMTKVLKTKFPF